MDYKIIVTTSDKSIWTIRPFMYLFNIYWSANQPVDILCESIPDFPLEPNFKSYVIADWPQDKWTDGLIKYLNSIKEQYVIILLDDYWLIRTADSRGIPTFIEYMSLNKSILRFDLTLDRLYANGPKYPAHDPDFATYGHYDIITRPQSQYQVSLMPAIWNKSLLLDVLEPGWNPWQVELQGTGKVNDREDIMVVGTRQWPVKIVNALRNEKDNIDTDGIESAHLEHIKQWFPKK